MKSAPSETAELLHRVRQQLILAQVRIMELEDTRDELAPKLADTEELLTAAQVLADQKTDEAAHLAKTLAALQAQYVHLRHMQHVTNEALNDTRRQLAESTGRLATGDQQRGQLQRELITLADEAGSLTTEIGRLGMDLAEANSTVAARLKQVLELGAEVREMKASRSWRWTGWLRSLERALGGGKP